MESTIQIPFRTAVFGGSQTVRIRRHEECATCKGSGRKPSAPANSECKTCKGQGMVEQMQRTPFGVISTSQVCQACRGTGQDPSTQCTVCGGQATTVQTRDVVVKIPRGVEDGAVLRIRGSGHAGKRGGARGDLYVRVTVTADDKFTRDGANLHSVEEILYLDAIVGTSLKVQTIDGPIEVKIPPGTQPDQKLRLRGKGAHKLNSDSRGDAFIQLKVLIPKKLSKEELELLDRLNALRTDRPSSTNDRPTNRTAS